ncbi:NAD(P)-binding domain-containing protein, partial [Stenotrophomonas sp.]|uniref:NAD(P)-binding domain-containing protein n=1 Tax=Stenotrophomonas sp. TaxID=69392 RepID=UPI0028AED166
MTVESITFIGGGNMARSLIAGLVRQGVPAAQIHVAEPVAALREALAADFGVQIHDNAAEAAAQGQTWLLAVKPQVLREVCQSLQPL